MTSARSSEPRGRTGSADPSRPDDYDDGTGGVGGSDRPAGAGAGARSDGPSFGLRGWLRWFWRQLTSMRVALMLLLLLAVATIPGSLLPQRSADPNGVVQYEADHPELFAILDAFPIQAFDVYSSAWFSAIYLLLFISLIGCVLPRIAQHWRALRGVPPRTPARLQRMVGFAEQRLSNPDATAAERTAYAERAVAEAERLLRRQRYRTSVQRVDRAGATELSVSAERGYLRETGNLVFHLALVGVLISVAIGGLFSFNGQKVLVEGETLVNQLIDYDSATSGTWFDSNRLEPFGMRLDALEIDYVTPDDENVNAQAIGLVREYRANVTLIDADGSERSDVIRVNHPMRVHGSPLYLIANGYAPTLTIRDPEGTVVFSESVPFIPQDAWLTSLGVVKVPYGLQHEGDETQLGLQGFFYPTKADLSTGAYTSNYPDLENPLLTLNVFVGDLGIDAGVPQSVYALDTSAMTQIAGRDLDVKPLELTIGETIELPDGMGTVTLDAVPRYASFDLMRNPAQEWVLISALLAVAGLLSSLFVPRRRVWVKAIPDEGGVTLQYAALARGDDPTLESAVSELRDRHRDRL